MKSCPELLIRAMNQAGLKLNIQKTKITASSPMTSWQIDGRKVKTVTDFIFLDFKITVDGDCSQILKMLAPWKESYDKPRQHIKKVETSLCWERSIW